LVDHPLLSLVITSVITRMSLYALFWYALWHTGLAEQEPHFLESHPDFYAASCNRHHCMSSRWPWSRWITVRVVNVTQALRDKVTQIVSSYLSLLSLSQSPSF
jgi:hypothetical protein